MLLIGHHEGRLIHGFRVRSPRGPPYLSCGDTPHFVPSDVRGVGGRAGRAGARAGCGPRLRELRAEGPAGRRDHPSSDARGGLRVGAAACAPRVELVERRASRAGAWGHGQLLNGRFDQPHAFHTVRRLLGGVKRLVTRAGVVGRWLEWLERSSAWRLLQVDAPVRASRPPCKR
jgi:hypothetical protein